MSAQKYEEPVVVSDGERTSPGILPEPAWLGGGGGREDPTPQDDLELHLGPARLSDVSSTGGRGSRKYVASDSHSGSTKGRKTSSGVGHRGAGGSTSPPRPPANSSSSMSSNSPRSDWQQVQMDQQRGSVNSLPRSGEVTTEEVYHPPGLDIPQQAAVTPSNLQQHQGQQQGNRHPSYTTTPPQQQHPFDENTDGSRSSSISSASGMRPQTYQNSNPAYYGGSSRNQSPRASAHLPGSVLTNRESRASTGAVIYGEGGQTGSNNSSKSSGRAGTTLNSSVLGSQDNQAAESAEAEADCHLSNSSGSKSQQSDDKYSHHPLPLDVTGCGSSGGPVVVTSAQLLLDAASNANQRHSTNMDSGPARVSLFGRRSTMPWKGTDAGTSRSGGRGTSSTGRRGKGDAFDDDAQATLSTVDRVTMSGASFLQDSLVGSVCAAFQQAVIEPCLPPPNDCVPGPLRRCDVVRGRATLLLTFSMFPGVLLTLFSVVLMYWASQPAVADQGGLLLAVTSLVWGVLNMVFYVAIRATTSTSAALMTNPSVILATFTKRGVIFLFWCLCWLIFLTLVSLAAGPYNVIPLVPTLFGWCLLIAVTHLGATHSPVMARVPLYGSCGYAFVVSTIFTLDSYFPAEWGILRAFVGTGALASDSEWLVLRIVLGLFTLVFLTLGMLAAHCLVCLQATETAYTLQQKSEEEALRVIVAAEVQTFTTEVTASLVAWDLDGVEELIILCESYIGIAPPSSVQSNQSQQGVSSMTPSLQAGGPTPPPLLSLSNNAKALSAMVQSATTRRTEQQSAALAAAALVPDAYNMVIRVRTELLPYHVIEGWRVLVGSLRESKHFLPPTFMILPRQAANKLEHLVAGNGTTNLAPYKPDGSGMTDMTEGSIHMTGTTPEDDDDEGEVPLTEEELQSVGSSRRGSLSGTINSLSGTIRDHLPGYHPAGSQTVGPNGLPIGQIEMRSSPAPSETLSLPGETQSILSARSHRSGHIRGHPASPSFGGAPSSVKLNKELGVIVPKRISMICLNILDFHVLIRRSGIEAATNVQKSALATIEKYVTASRGVIDYFQGDHVFATFNAVMPAASHAKKAAVAALSAIEEIESGDHSPAGAAGSVPSLRMTCGLSTGVAAVGIMGTHNRRRICTVGPVVSQASVLERLTKVYEGVKVLAPGSALGDIGFECLYQAVDIASLPGSKPNVIASLESKLVGIQAAQNREWMYQLQEQQHADPFAHVNAAFVSAIDGDAETALRCLAAKSSHKSERSVIGERGAMAVIKQLQEGSPFIGTDLGLFYDRMAPSSTKQEFTLVVGGGAAGGATVPRTDNLSGTITSLASYNAGDGGGGSTPSDTLSAHGSELSFSPKNVQTYTTLKGKRSQRTSQLVVASESPGGDLPTGGSEFGSEEAGTPHAGAMNRPPAFLSHAERFDSSQSLDDSTRGMLEASAGHLRELFTPKGTNVQTHVGQSGHDPLTDYCIGAPPAGSGEQLPSPMVNQTTLPGRVEETRYQLPGE